MLRPPIHNLISIPRHLVLLLWLAACLCGTAYAETPALSLTKGDLPLLVVAGHGGKMILEGAEVRSSDKVEDRHFVIFGDTHTNELAADLAGAVAARYKWEHQPSLLVNEIHRRYADVNRKPELSSHDPLGRAHHAAYHQKIEDELARLTQTHGFALLLDIHGQARYETTLLLGTAENSVISSWSKEILWGQSGLIESLKEAGFSAEPSTPDGKQRYGGGYTIRHHGEADSVEAWQLEHSRAVRDTLDERARYLEVVAEILVQAITNRMEKP